MEADQEARVADAAGEWDKAKAGAAGAAALPPVRGATASVRPVGNAWRTGPACPATSRNAPSAVPPWCGNEFETGRKSMRTYLDCFPCFLTQALRAGRMATRDEARVKQILDEVGMRLKDIPLDSTPAATGRIIYQIITRITGNPDPFREIKAEHTRKALALYPVLKDRIRQSPDPLHTAVKIAVAGNVIDMGALHRFDMVEEIERVLAKPFAVDDFETFTARLQQSDRVLFIGDNAGECVFDRLLMEVLPIPATYVVREKPVINDATADDARQAGIDKVAPIVSSGSDAPGTVLELCTPEFQRLFQESDLIISKGQGNYETLCDEAQPIFFLLKAKCTVIAHHLGVREGDTILKGNHT